MANVHLRVGSAESAAIATTANIHVTIKEDNNASIDRMHRTTFQARLGRRLDLITRKIIDNSLRLSSHPTDMIRISAKRDERSRDLVSRTIKSVEILPIILPPLKDIPLRHFVREGSEIQIPSLYTIDQQAYFEIYAPAEVKLEVEDLLFRMIYDENADEPYVLCLQVKEQFATVGYSTIKMKKFWCTVYDEALPQPIIDILHRANIKRERLQW